MRGVKVTTLKPSPKPETGVSGNVIEFPQDRFIKTVVETVSVNKNELTSIKALTSYVAHNKSVPEHIVRATFLAEFKIPSETDLRREDYERAIRFLVDLQTELHLLN